MADEIASAGAVAVPPAGQPPKRPRATVCVKQSICSFGTEVDLHVLVGETPLRFEGEGNASSVLIAIGDLVGTMRRGRDACARAVGNDESGGAALAVTAGIAGDIAAARYDHILFEKIVDDDSDWHAAHLLGAGADRVDPVALGVGRADE